MAHQLALVHLEPLLARRLGWRHQLRRRQSGIGALDCDPLLRRRQHLRPLLLVHLNALLLGVVEVDGLASVPCLCF